MHIANCWIAHISEYEQGKVILLHGNNIYTGGSDKIIRIWDKQSMSITTKLTKHKSRIVDMKVSVDSNINKDKLKSDLKLQRLNTVFFTLPILRVLSMCGEWTRMSVSLSTVPLFVGSRKSLSNPV